MGKKLGTCSRTAREMLWGAFWRNCPPPAAKFSPNWPTIDWCCPKAGQIWRRLANVGKHIAKFGRIRPPAKFNPAWANIGETLANLVQTWRPAARSHTPKTFLGAPFEHSSSMSRGPSGGDGDVGQCSSFCSRRPALGAGVFVPAFLQCSGSCEWVCCSATQRCGDGPELTPRMQANDGLGPSGGAKSIGTPRKGLGKMDPKSESGAVRKKLARIGLPELRFGRNLVKPAPVDAAKPKFDAKWRRRHRRSRMDLR